MKAIHLLNTFTALSIAGLASLFTVFSLANFVLAQEAAIFQAILPQLRRQTVLPIRLPTQLPPEVNHQRIYVSAQGSRNEYKILLESHPSCGATACYIGSFHASLTDRINLLDLQYIALANGIRGYYQPLSCGGSCSPPIMMWIQDGIVYRIQMRVSRDPDVALRSMIDLANSSIRQLTDRQQHNKSYIDEIDVDPIFNSILVNIYNKMPYPLEMRLPKNVPDSVIGRFRPVVNLHTDRVRIALEISESECRMPRRSRGFSLGCISLSITAAASPPEAFYLNNAKRVNLTSIIQAYYFQGDGWGQVMWQQNRNFFTVYGPDDKHLGHNCNIAFTDQYCDFRQSTLIEISRSMAESEPIK